MCVCVFLGPAIYGLLTPLLKITPCYVCHTSTGGAKAIAKVQTVCISVDMYIYISTPLERRSLQLACSAVLHAPGTAIRRSGRIGPL